MNKFLKAVITFSLKNKYFIFFAAAVLAVAGYISFRSIGIDAFPDVTNATVTIITQWPGRSAEEVEKFITSPIEIELNSAEKKLTFVHLHYDDVKIKPFYNRQDLVDFSTHTVLRNMTEGIIFVTLVPALASVLLRKNVREKKNIFLSFVHHRTLTIFNLCFKRRKIVFPISMAILAGGLFCFRFLGTEFLPQLNESVIYVRATGPLSISLDESVKLANEMRKIFLEFDEVKQVLSQTGRPNDGTDATGFYNIECHVDVFPEDQWKRKQSKEDLIKRMEEKLTTFPGVIFNFSHNPIKL